MDCLCNEGEEHRPLQQMHRCPIGQLLVYQPVLGTGQTDNELTDVPLDQVPCLLLFVRAVQCQAMTLAPSADGTPEEGMPENNRADHPPSIYPACTCKHKHKHAHSCKSLCHCMQSVFDGFKFLRPHSSVLLTVLYSWKFCYRHHQHLGRSQLNQVLLRF